MTVNLRWKKHPSGTLSAYLDIFEHGKRTKKYIDIKIKTTDKDKKHKKKLAEAVRTKYHNDLLNHKYDLVDEDKLNADFIEYFEEFVTTYRKAGVRKYRYALKKFKDFVSHYQRPTPILFRDLDHGLCNDFKEYLYSPDSGLSGETPYDYFKRFKAVVNKANRERYLFNDPAKLVKISKPTNTIKKEILSVEELQTLASTPCKHPDVRRAFLFACFTGLGEKEIRGLRWSHVQNGRLKTERAKNEEPINFELPETARELLGVVGTYDEKIFSLPSDVSVNKHLKAWVKSADIHKNISFYCARHSFAILNLSQGVNLKTIAKLMGHKTTASTNKYLNYLDAQKDQAMSIMPKLNLGS